MTSAKPPRTRPTPEPDPPAGDARRDGVADAAWLRDSPRHGFASKRHILVWDLLVRVFHWSLVLSFLTGFFITNKFPLHAYTGYVIFTLVLLRIVWGFVGSKYARFSAFTYTLHETVQYTLSALRMGEAREYLSHNPMGALMVFAILLLLLGDTVVGMMLYAAQQLEGPLEGFVPLEWDEDLLALHGALGKALIALAGMHIFGVVWASWWHRQNYVLAMFTGYKSPFTRRAKRRGDGQVWSEQERERARKADH